MNTSPADLEKKAAQAYQQKDYGTAIDAFSAAETSHRDQGNPLKAAEMANNLSVVHLQNKHPEQALAAVTGTPQLFLKHEDTLNAAFAFGNLAAALEACKRLDEAEEAYRTALSLFSDTGNDEALEQTAQCLSSMLLKQGRTFEALHSMQSGIEGKKKRSLKDRILQKLFNSPGNLLNR